MDYEKAYKEALETARKINNGDGVAAPADWTVCETIFPVLREDYDDMIRGAIIDHLKDNNLTEWADWLEKQREPIDKEKVLIGARKDVALSIMNFLDRNTLGMCLSNMECKDLEDAVVDSDWSKVYDYMKKKLEKQGNPAGRIEPKFIVEP